MADGKAGAVSQDSNNYVEPPRNGPGVNRSFTDYAQDPSVKETRRQAFENGRSQ